MKTFDKAWIFIGFFILSMILGYIINNVTYPQKTTPKTYHVEYQFSTKDRVLVSFDSSYSAILEDDPYKDKEISIEFLSVQTSYEILKDCSLEDYRYRRDKILDNIRQNLTTKVVQKFPDIEFQIIDMEIIIEL